MRGSTLLLRRQMKSAVIFFMYMCFCLFGRNAFATANIHARPCIYTSAGTIENASQVKNMDAKNMLSVTAATLPGEENAYAPDGDNEDEEDLIKKHPSLFKCLIAIYNTIIPGSFDRDHVGRLSSCYHLAFPSIQKYLVQRVIRI